MELTQEQINAFWDKVLKTDYCWEWQSHIYLQGYGRTQVKINNMTKIIYTHRLSYMLKYGNIPEGLLVLHKCDNRKCCNPDHLFLGTHQDNMTDMVNKGRAKGFDKYPDRQKEAMLLAKTPEAIEKKKNTLRNIKHQQKEKNSQYNTMWIYNLDLKESKKIKKDDIIPEGWMKGRKLKF